MTCMMYHISGCMLIKHALCGVVQELTDMEWYPIGFEHTNTAMLNNNDISLPFVMLHVDFHIGRVVGIMLFTALAYCFL